MIRQTSDRIDPKRRNVISHKKQQFADATYQVQEYPHRLNFYDVAPTAEIKLEEFEQWALDRLRVLLELESCAFRNKTSPETLAHMTPLLARYLPLSSNTSAPLSHADPGLTAQRMKDHYSHYILRLAFSGTEDLRRRFTRIESSLFRLRWGSDDARERQAFVESKDLKFEVVGEAERRALGSLLAAATPGLRAREVEEGGWWKVEWGVVGELVEGRRVLVRGGWAYVPGREQMSLVVGEFAGRLDKGLVLTSRALPRLDESDRLTPILAHLSSSFATPSSSLADADSLLPGAAITAASIDPLSAHFPLCMRNLHGNLRKNSHLKHFGRLQYTLFLKGIGLSLDECLRFWRGGFKLITDEKFDKEYRYNVRHVYGDVGGDASRRGKGYSPFSCQKILTEHPPGAGESHGCPYRHFGVDNLAALLQTTGVNERDVLRGVRDDVEKKRYHIACNRVFEWAHRGDLKRVKEDGSWPASELDVIVHPNTYFKRSWMLANGRAGGGAVGEDRMEM